MSGLLTRRERAGSAGQGDAAVYRPAAWVRVQGTAPSLWRPTYKTLDERRGRLTEAEERFERGRRTIGLFLGPLVFLVLLALPLDLEGQQQALAAVLGLVVVWWITEAIPIPVTGIIGLCLCVILNVAGADDVFGSVADSTIFLFIGSFIIAEAMLVHGLDRRFAFNILALRWVGNSTWRIIAAFGFIGAATSPFMSNGSTGARSSCSAPASPWARLCARPAWPRWSAWPSRPSRPACVGPAPPSAGAGPAAPAWP